MGCGTGFIMDGGGGAIVSFIDGGVIGFSTSTGLMTVASVRFLIHLFFCEGHECCPGFL
jgi:hypothetical protein